MLPSTWVSMRGAFLCPDCVLQLRTLLTLHLSMHEWEEQADDVALTQRQPQSLPH